MKTKIRLLPRLLLLAASVPLAAIRAVDNPPAKPAPAPKPAKELRVVTAHGFGAEIEKEPVTFLGVSTERASATLAEQLGLPKGMGLVVTAVVPDSPAASALKRHDILTKLNDQLLIDSNQLAVLVRSFKEGDEVTLTYVRGGKEATARVKLAKRDMPRMSTLEAAPLPPGMEFGFAVPGPGGKHVGRIAGLPRREVDDVLALVGEPDAPAEGATMAVRGGRPLARMLTIGDANLLFSDDEGSLELKSVDGRKALTATDKEGKMLFSGPINTEEERKAMPEAVRARLEKLESSSAFQFRTDDDFHEGRIDVIRPRARSILAPQAVPLPPPGPNTL